MTEDISMKMLKEKLRLLHLIEELCTLLKCEMIEDATARRLLHFIEEFRIILESEITRQQKGKLRLLHLIEDLCILLKGANRSWEEFYCCYGYTSRDSLEILKDEWMAGKMNNITVSLKHWIEKDEKKGIRGKKKVTT